MTTILRRMMFSMAAFIGVMGLYAGIASAATQHVAAPATTSTLHPFIPGGISSTDQQTAFSTVMSRASVDTSMSNEIAHLSGSSTFDASAYKPAGYQNGAPGSSNSGVSDKGTAVPTADTPECNVHSLMFVMEDTRTGIKVFFCVSCGNLRITIVVVVPKPHPFAKNTVLVVNRQYVRVIPAVCPGTGQKITVKVTSWVKTTIKERAWGKVLGQLTIKVNASFTQKLVNQTVSVTCSSLPQTPTAPTPQPPAQVFSATATATATASATCPDGTTATSSGSGFGSATSTVSQADADQKANAQATAAAVANANASVKCGSAPPPSTVTVPSVTITSATTLNDIPTGKTSGPFTYTVNASAAGTFTVDPGVGGVSDCNSSTPTGSFQAALATGNNSFCVIFYAPSDPTSKIASMSVTTTAIVTTAGGSAKDVKVSTFTISYPIRPVR